MLERLRNSIETIERLEKWNGHLYNWYDVTTTKPLNPKFVSTVDSGNFVGYYHYWRRCIRCGLCPGTDPLSCQHSGPGEGRGCLLRHYEG